MSDSADNTLFEDDERSEYENAAPIGAHAAPAPEAPRPQTPAHAAPGSFEPEDEPAVPAAMQDDEPLPPVEDDLGPAPESLAGVPYTPEAPADPAAPAHADIPAEPAASEPATPIDVVPDPAAQASPEDTAEIDVAAVEAQLSDPGSTQSFAPISDELIDTDATFDAGTSAMLMWGARSDVGCVRNHNEDSYLVASPLFCVCDGMGGHAAGEVASAIAVETIAKTGPKTADAAQLGAAIEAANAAIIEAAVNGVGRPGMGCTATAAVIDGTTLAIAHVGDSRAYLLHEGTLIRVTRDHSYVEELVDAGEITADEARVHPNRSVITRALGSDPAMYADHFTLNIEEGDRLILCSDGLSSMIPDGEIERVAQQSSTAQICVDNLVDAALAAGGSDNVTVVVVDIRDDGRMRELAKKHRRNALIGVLLLLAAIAVAGVVTFSSITGSVYLGVKDDAVAVYKGVPDSPFGLELHWLQDETSVSLADLPEDTQKRLRAGIPQKSLDEAMDAVDNYRTQIEESQKKALQDVRAIRDEQGPASAVSSSNPAQPVAPSDPNNTPAEGGAE
ncbi:MAG: Stp1/IreP family PP2C-type Ser/Thr phosphatase [Coriobacteriaceae bacterium]|nr:Stp1/IreP family PP2C-type Ser/Thr phosphatase [Coriobacteriaceae bacterium]